jgi:hypothetical protein
MLRGKDRNLTTLCGKTGGLNSGLKAYDWELGPTLTQMVDSCGSSCVTPHNNHLDTLAKESLNSSLSKAYNLLARATTIGAVLAIAKIYERLIGKQSTQLTPHRQTSKARIIDSNSCCVHL